MVRTDLDRLLSGRVAHTQRERERARSLTRTIGPSTIKRVFAPALILQKIIAGGVVMKH